MKKTLTLFLSILFLLILSCKSESEDDCTKTIIVQYEFNLQSQYGIINYPEITQEVPCDFPEPDAAETITELPRLEEFSYEILELNVIPDTGNNTSKISYKIQLNNLSNNKVNGLPYLTTRVNNDSFTVSYVFNNSCSEIEANSSCIISFEGEESLDIAQITSFLIEEVEYLIIK
tara:strand:- start:54 stop:578 length:525 start_codon:yes stop_codon:yes gene_type:complete